jgi:HD-GYP domain-containing protein (c-di-GMP phosphodiesterase class II)
MDETAARDFLQALRRIARQVQLYPRGHPSTDEAIRGACEAAGVLAGEKPDTVLSIAGDLFYLDRVLLPHSSLEFNTLLRDMRNRGIESVAVAPPVSEHDVFDLAAFTAGTADDLPVGGSIRLNAAIVDEEQGGSPVSRLRSSYAGSLAAIRNASTHLAAEGAFELNSVVASVEDMLESSANLAGAALLLSSMKGHDGYTFYHSVNTSLLSLGIGRLLGLDRDDLIAIGSGALLHDIGKVSVSSKTLKHPGRLSEEQWLQIEIHPREGAQAILAAGGPGSDIAAMIAFEHHLRYDGGGYPRLAKQRMPHVFSRLVAITDIYDSITSRRPYRRAETPNRALRILLDGAGTSYDPELVHIFIAMLGVYPPGSILRMQSGEIVVITYSDPHQVELPHGVVVRDAAGNTIDDAEILVDPGDVAEQLLPDQAGFDPVAMLEDLAVVGLPSEILVS